jgi:hypothetical protein
MTNFLRLTVQATARIVIGRFNERGARWYDVLSRPRIVGKTNEIRERSNNLSATRCTSFSGLL